MASLMRTVQIDAPPEAAWRAVADLGAVADWAPAVREAHCTTATASGIGCARLVTAANGSTVEEVVVAWDEGRMIAFEIPDGIAPAIASLRETWVVAAAASGCRVAVRMDWLPRPGVVRRTLARAVIVPALGRMLTRNLVGLRSFVESGLASGDQGCPTSAST